MKKLTFIGIPLSLLLGLVLSTVGLTTRAAAADFIVTSNDEADLRIAIAKAEVLYTLSGRMEASTITFAANVTGTITLTMGELAITSPLTIIGPGANLLTISGNNASRVFSISSGNTVTLDGLTVSRGFSGDVGGGISNSGTLMITNCTVTLNSTHGFDGSGGGGIVNLSGGTLTVTNSTVSNNSVSGIGAGGGGGGIRNNGGTLMLTNSTVSGNSSDLDGGGGIYSNGGTVTITNSTVSFNSTFGSGGGILNVIGSLSVTNSTVTGNRSNSSSSGGTGGGIIAYGTETLNNTIVAGNFRGTAATANDIDGPIETANHNLIGDVATSGGITNGVSGNKVGNSGVGTLAINTVLNFTLANNGGPTRTHALVPGSPAIDAGSNALALDAASNPLTTDQRDAGFPRINGGTVDIGAFEVLPVSIDVTTSPIGLGITIDGNPYTSPQTFNWTPGSNHTIATTSPQSLVADTQYVFLNWSDAGAISHSVTAPASPTTYTATFKTQHQLTTSASTGGTISPASGFYDQGNVVISATANPGYTFTGFTGALTGTTNPQTLNLNAQASVTANFTCAPITATVSGNGTIRPGQSANVTVTLMGGTSPYTVTLNNNGGTQTGASPLQFTVSPAATTTYAISSAVGNNGCPATPQGSATIIVDGTPPTITCPPAQVAVSAGSSVAVTYPAPTVTDNNPGATYTCTPPASATFALGTTTVTCTATDVAGNTAQCGFTVVVRTPRAAVNNLKAQTQALVPGTLSQALANQLIGHLELASTRLEQGQTAMACTHLQNFINQVNVFRGPGGPLTTAQGQALIDYATKIRTALGCSG